MLRRRLNFISCAKNVVATTSATSRHTVSNTNNNDSNTASASFNFKNSVNARRLSNAKSPPTDEVPRSPATDSPVQKAINGPTPPQPNTQRSAFVGMLNRLSEQTDESASNTKSKKSSSDADTNGSSTTRIISFVKNIPKFRPSVLLGAQTRKEALLTERKRRLVFRDESGGEIDKFRLFSDPMLFVKYLRLGVEFASDSELENRLRYYKEHVSKEILTCDGGKLMRGAKTLFPVQPTMSLVATAAGVGGVGSVNVNVGVKGFIAASVLGSPNYSFGPSKVVGDAAPISGICGLPLSIASPSTASTTVASGAGAEAAVTNVSNYYPTANPSEVLRLPRIVASQLAQFTGTSRPSGAANRVSGTYLRAYQQTEDIANEARLLQQDGEGGAKRAFLGKGTTQHVFTGTNFRRPAMLVVSQLGVKIGTEANNAWCCSALKYLEPSSPFIALFDETCNSGNVYGRSMLDKRQAVRAGSDDTINAVVERAAADRARLTGLDSGVLVEDVVQNTSAAPCGGAPLKRPVDLYCLRSLDLHPYKFMQRLYVKRFAAAMGNVGAQLDAVAVAQKNNGAQPGNDYLFGTVDSLTRNTFVGCGLLKNFFEEPFRLRNYVATTVILVDHHGRVRWLSGGKPDEAERALLPKLLKELEMEYLAALSGRRS